MRILAIETSCDETAISVVDCAGGLDDPSFSPIAEAVLSQVETHQKYGGVVPTIAKREHIKALPIVLEQVLEKLKAGSSNLKAIPIDVIAVTIGPGLEPALWTGIEFAKKLATEWGKPLIAVNHMEGHLVSPLIGRNEQFSISNFQFPKNL